MIRYFLNTVLLCSLFSFYLHGSDLQAAPLSQWQFIGTAKILKFLNVNFTTEDSNVWLVLDSDGTVILRIDAGPRYAKGEGLYQIPVGTYSLRGITATITPNIDNIQTILDRYLSRRGYFSADIVSIAPFRATVCQDVLLGNFKAKLKLVCNVPLLAQISALGQPKNDAFLRVNVVNPTGCIELNGVIDGCGLEDGRWVDSRDPGTYEVCHVWWDDEEHRECTSVTLSDFEYKTVDLP